MDILEEIKKEIRTGRCRLRSMNWLVIEVEKQRKIYAEMRVKSRFNNYMKIAEENLVIAKELAEVRKQRDHYKQAYEALLKAL